jgi:hypothetical protein
MDTIDIKLDDFFEHNDCLIYDEVLDTSQLVEVLKSEKKREEFLKLIEKIPLTEE